MFSRISQFSKNIADELNEAGKTYANKQQQQQHHDEVGQAVKTVEKYASALKAETPDPNSLDLANQSNEKVEIVQEQPAAPAPDTQNTAEQEDSEKAGTEASAASPEGANVSKPAESANASKSAESANVSKPDELPSDTPIRIRKKWDQYEDKYPKLLAAYRQEKRKAEVVRNFEIVLREYTPCSSISETALLVEHLSNQKEQMKLQGDELRKMNVEINTATQENKQLKDTIAELEKKRKEDAAAASELKQKLTSLESSVDSLSKEKDVQGAEISALSKEKQASSDRSDALSEEVAALTKKLQATADDHQAAVKELDAAREKLAAAPTETQSSAEGSLQKELDAARSECDDLKAKLAELQANTSTIETANASDEPSQDLQKQVDSLSKMCKLYQEKIKKLESDIASSVAAPAKTGDNKKKGKGGRAKTQNNASSIAEKELESLRESSGAEIEALRSQINTYKEKVDDLEGMLKEVGNDLVATRDQLKNENKDDGAMTTLKEKIKSLEDELASFNEVKPNLEKEINNLQGNSKLQDENIKRLKEENDGLVNEIRELKDSLANLKQELASKSEELNTTKDKLTKSILAQDSLKAEIAKLKQSEKSLKDSSSSIESLKKANTAFVAEISSLKDSLAVKEEAIANLQQRADSLEALKGKAEGRIAVLRQTVQRIEQDRNQANEAKEKAEKELRGLATSKSRLEEERTRSKNELSQIKAALQQSESAKNASESLLESMKKQFDELGMQSSELRSRVDTLESELSDTQKHLQDRIRETTTMRRLLNESEGSLEPKLTEAYDRIRNLSDEKDRLEGDLIALSRKKQRESDEHRHKLSTIERDFDIVQEERTRYYKELQEIRASRSNADERAHSLEKELAAINDTMSELRKALVLAEAQLKETQKEKLTFKSLAEDCQQKLDKLQRNQRLLNDDLQALRTQRVELEAKIASSKEASQKVPGTLNGGSTKDLINAPYMKNVLLEFAERKGQRQLMMPVLSNLLSMTEREQQKFSTAFQ